jgi:hypothetical protein
VVLSHQAIGKVAALEPVTKALPWANGLAWLGFIPPVDFVVLVLIDDEIADIF